MRAFVRKGLGNGETDALACSGDHRYLSGEVEVHGLSSRRSPARCWRRDQDVAKPVWAGWGLVKRWANASGVGDLAPAAVGGERVPAARHLDHLGHAGVALLVLVGGAGDRRRSGMVLLAGDE
jgi:hypothetical protein